MKRATWRDVSRVRHRQYTTKRAKFGQRQMRRKGPARAGIPDEVKAINAEISRFMDTVGAQGQKIGGVQHGVYAFFDYEEEPIYVGQTKESLRQRIGRHLTNQRTDAVAMNVLDPFEVAFIEVWPLIALKGADAETINRTLNAMEYTVFQKVLAASTLHAVLNEKDIAATDLVELPPSYRRRIIPEQIYQRRNHPDIRIARRASTIARLAQVISERNVSLGLRRTLTTQARRLQKLAAERFSEFELRGATVEQEHPGEETGESSTTPDQ